MPRQGKGPRLWVTVVIGGVACVLYAFSVWVSAAHAQKAERGTQQWMIPATSFTDDTVTVKDTTGVCLYVTSHGGIAAVPKTQLPQGSGCQ